jgi:hypothetical protein
METMPDAVELVEAAIESLRADVLPAVGGRPAFQLRVVLNVLDIVRRELRGAAAADAAELARLRALPGLGVPPSAPGIALGAAPADPLPPLRAALCDALREGRIDLDTPGLAAHLWADVLARMAIEQPTYPSYLREAAGAADALPATPTADRP